MPVETIAGPRIPEHLRRLPDAPKRLYLDGRLPARQPVAIVGSRKATPYGRQVAAELGAKLGAAGIPVVSGLAFGIDAAAHQGVLDGGGTSVAILPGGLAPEHISPRTNFELARAIVDTGGGLLSEYPPETEVQKGHYHARNRLIAGLAEHVVVVEAAWPSGSTLTAHIAMEQGRTVWAVPGPIMAPQSEGTNKLIAEGAHPLTDIDDFLRQFGVAPRPSAADGLLAYLTKRPQHVDELGAAATMPVAEIERELTKLEMTGLARRVGGRYFVRT